MEPVSIRTHHLSLQNDRLHKTLATLRSAIWEKRPVLGDIMKKHGEKILFEYSKDFVDVNSTPALDERKEELIACVEEIVSQRLGAAVAQGVGLQLRRLPLVSTADHHAPIDHPFWVNANLITALPSVAMAQGLMRYLVVFPFASVSLNNASGYPRGVEFHGGMDGSSNLIKLPLLPDKLKMGVVHGMRSYTREDLDRAKKDLQRKMREGQVAPERGAAVLDALERYFGAADVLGAADYSSQITKLNYRLWPSLFHSSTGETAPCADTLPDLVYVEIESIVSQLLLRRHLTDTSSLLYRALFDSTMREPILRAFDGIPGAFSRQNDSGTYFFWAVDDRNRRLRLRLEGDRLRTSDGSVEIPLDPLAIAEHLRRRTIFPSMLTCYLMISLHYGMKCLGGFCQVHDLTVLKEAWRSVLNDVGERSEADAILPVQTKELGGDGMVLAYTRSLEGDLVPATGIDMLIDRKNTSFSKYVRRSATVTLNEMMDAMLPEMYTVLYAAADRDPLLCLYSPEEILRGTGLQEKLMQESSEMRLTSVC